MSDANVFARFVYEMRTLLTAIESHVVALGASSPSDRRSTTLQEIARLSNATAALAEAFEVNDLRTLALALAMAATDASETSDDGPFAPLGARDTLTYMKWRLDRSAAVGHAEAPSEHDRALARRLERLLSDRSHEAPSNGDQPAPVEAVYAGAGELTQDELELVQAFPSANLRQRDAQADARMLARVTGAPAFIAQTTSGADVPVFGGMTADDLDEIPPEMKRIFVKETQADLRDLGQFMLDFEQQTKEATALANMGYLAHKLKGSAATMGFNGFATIAICFEDALKSAQGAEVSSDADYKAGLGRFLDLFQRALEAAAALDEPAPALIEEARRVRDSMTHTDAAHTAAAHTAPLLPQQPPGSDRHGERSHAPTHDLVLHIEARKLDMLMNQLSALAANRGAVTRNRGEIARAQMEMQAALVRLREKSAQITDAHPLTFDNLSAAQQGGAAPGGSGAWLAERAPIASATPSGVLRASWSNLQLEQYTEVDTALRALAEVVADVAANYGTLSALLNRLGQLTEAQETLTRDIQEDAMGIRLAQLAEITPRLRISAHVAATDLGKLIEFDVQGDSIEVDRSLLEALEEPLIQLLRNAIAHGIEGPEERLEAGKPTTGHVWIHAYNAVNEVVIEVGDDGRGINANLLVGAAIGAQLISSVDARQVSQEQAFSLMFRSGVSTSGITAAGYAGVLAGSGIGLAGVASVIHALKGSISVHSEMNKGTSFQIRAPISLSVAPILEVKAGGQVFALPFALVESTAIIRPELLREREARESQLDGRLREWRLTLDALDSSDTLLSLANAENTEAESGFALQSTSSATETPAYALAEMLGFEQDVDALRRVVVIKLRGQMVALLVESVGDGKVREATVRPLPRRLQRRVVRGVVVRPEDGEVALLVDPQEALAQRLAGAEIALRPAFPHIRPRNPSPSILIVDDSVTIRHTLDQTLTAAGFKTRQAQDGYDALELMEQELPRVVILDVEMPRLSGFELLTIMRSSPQYQRVRVAMLTSRAADKHREYALAIGADAYLVKPCPQETLVETIRRLLSESEPE